MAIPKDRLRTTLVGNVRLALQRHSLACGSAHEHLEHLQQLEHLGEGAAEHAYKYLGSLHSSVAYPIMQDRYLRNRTNKSIMAEHGLDLVTLVDRHDAELIDFALRYFSPTFEPAYDDLAPEEIVTQAAKKEALDEN